MKILKGGRNPDGTNPDFGLPVARPSVPIIGAAKPTILVAVDLVEERRLDEGGMARFFASLGKEWGRFMYDRDVLGATLLAAADEAGISWSPLVGARVVLRLESGGFVAFDLATRGDGSTIQLPARPAMSPDGAPVVTPLGHLLHCPIQRATGIRLEVDAPGFGGARVRAILHGVEAREVP